MAHLTMVTLTFDSATPNSLGFLCRHGQMCRHSLRNVGQGVLELLIGNDKVTNRLTDQPTNRHVQSNMSSLLRRRACGTMNKCPSQQYWGQQISRVSTSRVIILAYISIHNNRPLQHGVYQVQTNNHTYCVTCIL